MRVSFSRSPKSENSPYAVADFDGHLCPVKLSKEIRGLQIDFEDNPGGKGSYFNAYILSGDFGQLAREMLKADPQAAVRAFGTALQEVDINLEGASPVA